VEKELSVGVGVRRWRRVRVCEEEREWECEEWSESTKDLISSIDVG
jgi:hypothetical protein